MAAELCTFDCASSDGIYGSNISVLHYDYLHYFLYTSDEAEKGLQCAYNSTGTNVGLKMRCSSLQSRFN